MKTISLLLLIILSACSSYRGVNRIGESKLTVNSGLKGSVEWSDSLEFSRRSFYQEANMMYDFLVSKVEKDSPFNQWFGPMPANCSQVYILLSYVKQGALLTPGYLAKQIEDSGYSIITVPTFSNHIKSNASFQQKNLGFYKVRALCPKTGNSGSNIVFNIPGYKTTTVEF